MNLYKYFIIFRNRFFYLLELKNIRCSVFCAYNCFHTYSPKITLIRPFLLSILG